MMSREWDQACIYLRMSVDLAPSDAWCSQVSAAGKLAHTVV